MPRDTEMEYCCLTLLIKKVWSKAVKDSTGLVDFYEKNKNNYMWDRRCDAIIYTCANADIAAKTRKLLKKNKSMVEVLQTINKDSQLNLTTRMASFRKVKTILLMLSTGKKVCRQI